MAMYHLRAKFVKRSEGRSAVAASAYRACEKLVDERAGVTHDYTRKGALDHSEILLPEGLPETLQDRGTLWNTVETSLTHPRAQPAFEVEVALPRELTRDQCVELARRFAQEQFVSNGLVVDLAIHRPTAADGLDHPHAHMLIATRRFHGDGSLGKTARDMQDSPVLLQKVYALEKEGRIDEALLVAKGTNLARWREGWAELSNDFLSDSGSDARIDHRTLEAQKIDREATPNIGFAVYRDTGGLTGWLARKVEAFKGISWRNQMRGQFDRITSMRRDLTAEFIANARNYAKDLIDGLEPEKEKGAEYER